jgi:hypothetical protein
MFIGLSIYTFISAEAGTQFFSQKLDFGVRGNERSTWLDRAKA